MTTPPEPEIKVDMLTDLEHGAVRLTGELWNVLAEVAGDGPARKGDLAELRGHIHAIQQAILSQAAARAYPGRYRLLGDPDWQGGNPVYP